MQRLNVDERDIYTAHYTKIAFRLSRDPSIILTVNASFYSFYFYALLSFHKW